MNYELALKLKKDGFPQNYGSMSAFYYDGELYTVGNYQSLTEWKDNPDGSGFHTASDGGCGCCSSGVGLSVNEYTVCPTLSELIEACGIGFSELSKMTHTKEPQKWVAYSYSCEQCGIENTTHGYGITPEEAVAKLWLELNKK